MEGKENTDWAEQVQCLTITYQAHPLNPKLNFQSVLYNLIKHCTHNAWI